MSEKCKKELQLFVSLIKSIISFNLLGHKIIVPRWMSRRLGVYDIAAKQWHFKLVPSLD